MPDNTTLNRDSLTERELWEPKGTHTAEIGDYVYDIYKLRPYAESLPVQSIPLAVFESRVAPGEYYWHDTEGNWLGPHQLLEDWEAAQKNPLWAKHVEKIKRVNADTPIWVINNSEVIDGMHRLTKAFLEKRTEINCRFWTSLPEEAIVKEINV